MAKKPALDIEALSKQLTDADVSALLKLRTTLRKERMAWLLIGQMEYALEHGVDVVHEGEVSCQKRATPGELFRIRQALDAFDPSDLSTAFKNDSKSIADGLSADPHSDLETLRSLATEDQTVDRPAAATPPLLAPPPPAKAPPRPSKTR